MEAPGGGRSLLGPADVTDDVLLDMVGGLLGRPVSALVDVHVDEVAYDLPAITTAGRHRVRGTAIHDDGAAEFGLFVKQVQEWSRSPHFEDVPPELREWAAGTVPWRTEAAVYRSDLVERLPDGLTMPRSLGVFDLDPKSAAIWLEHLAVTPVEWDVARYRSAARLLGRLAASPAVAPLAAVGGHEWDVGIYLAGRVEVQVVPMLRDEGIWRHPLVAGAFDPALRARLLAAVDLLDRYGAELLAAPTLVGHGDACPNNILAVDGRDELVLIDFGFWNPTPVGFDLGQLLAGDVQIGRRRADGLGGLAALDELLVTAYVDGLRAEGCELPRPLVERAHALQLLVFTGLSAVPWDLLDAPITAELRGVAADRASLVRFSLDLLDRTGG